MCLVMQRCRGLVKVDVSELKIFWAKMRISHFLYSFSGVQEARSLRFEVRDLGGPRARRGYIFFSRAGKLSRYSFQSLLFAKFDWSAESPHMQGLECRKQSTKAAAKRSSIICKPNSKRAEWKFQPPKVDWRVSSFLFWKSLKITSAVKIWAPPYVEYFWGLIECPYHCMIYSYDWWLKITQQGLKRKNR